MTAKKIFSPRRLVTFILLCLIIVAFGVALKVGFSSGYYINVVLFPLQLMVMFMSIYTFLPAVLYLILRKKVNQALKEKTDEMHLEVDLPPFILLIPAHNEAATLPTLFRSITQELNYPKSKFKVIVIADNCNDATADLARNVAGVEVFERKTTTRSDKTQALAFAAKIFEGYPEAEKDTTVVILDADGIIDANFLLGLAKEMIQKPSLKVLQSNRFVENKAESDTSLLDAASEAIRQRINSGVRHWLGMENYLYGLGSCFQMRIFIEMTQLDQLVFADDKAWKAHLSERNVEIGYAPQAKIGYVACAQKADFQVQRLRWVRGHYDMIYRFFVPMFFLAFKRLNLSDLDFSLSIITLPRTFLLMFCALFFLIGAATSQFSFVPTWVWLIGILAYLFYGVLGLKIIQSQKYSVLFSSYALVIGVIKANMLSLIKKEHRVWQVNRSPKKTYKE